MASRFHTRGEDGFTMIEVVVAVFVLVLGMLASFEILNAAGRNSARAKATQVALERAQDEMERLHSLTYEQVALTATPAHNTSPSNPLYRVSGGTYAVNRDGTDLQTMAVNGGSLYGGGQISGGMINPGPETFSSGDVSGRIYRIVVWRNDPACDVSCDGGQDYKQVIVAVKLDPPPNQSYDRGYIEIHSDFIDPEDSVLSEPDPGATVVTAQQFFLTDTPCAATAPTTRQDITGEHLLHNTRGTCASGAQTGTTPGAPDTLMIGAPPDPSPLDPNDPPTYDYSNDFYLEPNPDTDKGVQIRRQDTSGCNYDPGGTNPESMIHRWVTDPLPFDFAMRGKATLEFFTRSLNGTLHTGRMCVYLFRRHETGSPPVATDTRYINKGGTGVFGNNSPFFGWAPGGNGFWPQTWSDEALEMTFGPSTTSSCPCTIPAGDRLGVAISIDRGQTPADAIPVLYDHPNFRTRLEVDTTTPLEGSD